MGICRVHGQEDDLGIIGGGRVMKNLILLLMFFSAPVMAVEPITGAFGQVA